MNAPTKLGLYGVGLGVVFAASFTLARLLIPADASTAWTHSSEQPMMTHSSSAPSDH